MRLSLACRHTWVYTLQWWRLSLVVCGVVLTHLQTGPTNAVSLLMFYSLLTVADTGSYEFIVAAGLMAVMVGIIQILVGVAHMGV